MTRKERKALEDGGLIYRKNEPKLILKARVILSDREIQNAIDAIEEKYSDNGIFVIPECFDVVYPTQGVAKWEIVSDKYWSGGEKCRCSGCGYGYSLKAYFEPYDFKYCPNCGRYMMNEEMRK